MPTYEYQCDPCDHTWDVAKTVAQIDAPEACEKCNELGWRRMPRGTGFTGASDWNNQGFNPALGVVTKSNKHAREIAKAKGMIEVGNEPVEKIHKHFDDARAEKREQRYRDAENLK